MDSDLSTKLYRVFETTFQTVQSEMLYWCLILPASQQFALKAGAEPDYWQRLVHRLDTTFAHIERPCLVKGLHQSQPLHQRHCNDVSITA